MTERERERRREREVEKEREFSVNSNFVVVEKVILFIYQHNNAGKPIRSNLSRGIKLSQKVNTGRWLLRSLFKLISSLLRFNFKKLF